MSKRRIAPLVLAAVLAGAVLEAAGAQEAPATPQLPAAAPHAAFEKLEIDAGDVPRGQDLPVTFVVRNTGDAVLKILSAKPG